MTNADSSKCQLSSFSQINKNHTLVEWEEPTVFDNSFQPVTIERSLNFSYLDAGVHEVRYMAADASQNFAECAVNVTVEERKCQSLVSPTNAQSICARNATHTWCEIVCDSGFTIVKAEEVLDSLQLVCENRDALWVEAPPTECVLLEQPESVEEVFTITLDADPLICEDSEAQNGVILNKIFSVASSFSPQVQRFEKDLKTNEPLTHRFLRHLLILSKNTCARVRRTVKCHLAFQTAFHRLPKRISPTPTTISSKETWLKPRTRNSKSVFTSNLANALESGKMRLQKLKISR